MVEQLTCTYKRRRFDRYELINQEDQTARQGVALETLKSVVSVEDSRTREKKKSCFLIQDTERVEMTYIIAVPLRRTVVNTASC